MLQAVQLQPNSVRALYRLASAQYHLQRVRQCVDTCTSALVIRPGARQLHQLRHQAEDMLRATFLSTRHCEVSCATNQATLAAANKTMVCATAHTTAAGRCQCLCSGTVIVG